MPKRIVDGEALWTSGKLKRVPQELRTHYANWLPLAEANGVFEVDFDIIKARVYPILDPDFSTENVQEVFAHFKEAGLLQVWNDAGKTWAYFVGIGKSGRLPVEAHLKRYKGLPPNPPAIRDQSGTGPGQDGNTPQGFGSGLVLDRFGSGMEDDVKIKNSLIDKSRAILGVRISPQDANWSEIKALVRVYGEDAVASKFEEWAKSQTQAPNYPLSGFVRIADALLTGKFGSSVEPEYLSALVNDLVAMTDGAVVFNNKQRAAISCLMTVNSPEDIKSAFREYYGNISGDDFKVSHAAREFTETAEQLLFVQAKRKADAARTSEQLRICTENEQARAAAEARKLLEAEVEEQNLIEDTL